MAEYYDVDRITNDQTGDIIHLKDYSLGKAVSSPAPIVSFQDGAPYPMGLTAEIDPVQDLHGYDHPWPGGGGKNLLPLTVDGIKAANTDGTWNGNTYTWDGVTFAILTDDSGNVIGINVNGSITTSAANRSLNLYIMDVAAGQYKLNGCPSGGGNGTSYILQAISSTSGIDLKDAGNGTTMVLSSVAVSCRFRIVVFSGYTASNKVFYPMLRFSTESADFAPYTNICPISGFDRANVTVTGKNLWNGKFVTSAYAENDSYSSTYNCVGNYAMRCKVGKRYTFSIDGVATQMRYAFLDANKSRIESLTTATTTVEAPSDAVYIQWRSYDAVSSGTVKAQIEEGTSASDYTPCVEQEYPITFPTSAGTVYGGTVTVNPDGTGELVVDKAGVNMGNVTYTYANGCMISGNLMVPGKEGEIFGENPVICSIYQKLAKRMYSSEYEDKRIGLSTTGTQFIAKDSTYSDPSAFKTAMSGQTLVYEIENPAEYNLTATQIATLLGINNVWADTGDIKALSYVRNTVPELIRQDTAGQISSALDPVESSLAIVIDGDVAVGGLASGKYVFLRSHSTLARGLYHTTASIADGASITANNTEPDDEGGLNSLLADLIVERNRLTALTRHTRLTDFSLTDLQNAVADQDLAKYGLKEGDYKTINGYDYVIAGLNVMKGTHNYTCTGNHVGLIVISHTTCKWNTSSSTAGGYKSSNLHSYLVSTVLPHAQTDLGSTHLYQHKKLLSNAVDAEGYNRFGTNTGCSSGWEWVDCYISALTEAQVYGGDHWSSSGYDTGEANTLLPVFAEYKHTDIFGNEYVWLRNVSSASQACYVSHSGYASGTIGVTNAYYVAGLILYH